MISMDQMSPTGDGQASPASVFSVELSPLQSSGARPARSSSAPPYQPRTPMMPAPLNGNPELAKVIKQIRAHIEDPLLPLPAVQRGKRARVSVPEDQLRRSARIAKTSRGLPTSYVQRAQRVLMVRLGFCHFEDEPSVDCLARYADLFKDPLPTSSIDALTKLFALEPFADVAPTMLAY